MSFADRLDAFQRRHAIVGFPIAVVYKFGDDQGPYLSALITYYGFLSLFPLALLATTILGYVLHGNPDLQQKIYESALAQFPVLGDVLKQQGGLQGSTTAVIIGVLGSLWAALGVAQATQNALNVAWAVPRNRRPNPFLGRLRSLLLLSVAAIGILVTTFVSTLGSSIDALGTNLGGSVRWLLMVVTVAVNTAIFMLVFRLATTHDHSLRRTLPGAVATAVAWQILQLIGAAYVQHVIKNSSVSTTIFATILGMFAYIYLGALAVVIGAEINVVNAYRLFPRALLTPFTDNVDLTDADLRAYANYASMQRTKNFERVDVRFEHGGQYRSARRAAEEAGEEDVTDPSPPRVQDKTSGQPKTEY